MLQGSVLLCHSQKEGKNVNTRPSGSGEGSYSVGKAATRIGAGGPTVWRVLPLGWGGSYSVGRAAARMGGSYRVGRAA